MGVEVVRQLELFAGEPLRAALPPLPAALPPLRAERLRLSLEFLHFHRVSAKRKANRRSRWHDLAHSASCGFIERRPKAREGGRHKSWFSGRHNVADRLLCRPHSRAWVASIPDPQLGLWAKSCRQLRWLGVRFTDAGVQI